MTPPKRKKGKAPRKMPAPDKILNEKAPDHLKLKAEEAKYEGISYHKRNVASYPNLKPPADPRPNKTHCDNKRPLKFKEALRLLRLGIEYGICSKEHTSGFFHRVWAVDENEQVFEAKSGKHEPHHNVYHGYPLEDNDPMYEKILRLWKKVK